MRVFKFIATGLLSLSLVASYGQTVTRDSVTIQVKSDNMPKAKRFNTWDIGIHGGITYPNTDIAASNFNDANVKRRLAFGLDVSKFFTHNFAFRLRGIHGNLSGVDTQKPQYRYNTTIDYDVTINLVGQLGNISFLKRTPNLAFYGSIGVGFIRFTPEVSIDGGNNYLSGIYSQYKDPLDTVDYSPTTDLVIPFSLGAKYRISNRFSLNLEWTYRTMRSDKLDGWYKLLSEDDDYTYLNLGATVHLGGEKKMLEWVNPLQNLYADVYDMKDKVDLMAKDSDSDGVADIFDREPDTPAGNKVYGDGTSIDSDGDGVPDKTDVQPFSPRGVIVDASGREIDTDADGIPDARDRDNTTAKGVLVDTSGVAIPVTAQNKPRGGGSSVLSSAAYLPSIFFDLDSYKIDPKYNETLAEIALILAENKDLKLRVIGNCDFRASAEYNAKLGKRRAEAIKDHLVERYGIDRSRFITESFGKDQPITSTDTRMNRRVDLKIAE